MCRQVLGMMPEEVAIDFRVNGSGESPSSLRIPTARETAGTCLMRRLRSLGASANVVAISLPELSESNSVTISHTREGFHPHRGRALWPASECPVSCQWFRRRGPQAGYSGGRSLSCAYFNSAANLYR